MTQYAFATTWDLEAPIERVWAALLDEDRWTEWFPSLRKVETVEQGSADGVGRVLRATVRAALPYDLTFDARITRVEPPNLFEVTAVGDLDASGRATLAEEGGVTTVRVEWRARTTKPWMNALAPVARPAFAWNHGVAMTAAGKGLARQLAVPLLSNESGPLERSNGGVAAAAVLAVAVVAGTAVAVARHRSRV